MGVKDPKTGKPSWPITFEPIRIGGSTFSRYWMPAEVAAIVLQVTGRNR